MCQLGKQSKEFTLTKDNALECYRWFTFHDGHLGSVGHLNSGNPWLNKIVKADIAPLLNTNGVYQDPNGNETPYEDFYNPVTRLYEKNKIITLPKFGNSTGLYCYKTIDEAKKDGSMSHYILAKIKVWGQLVEHDNGYRAEFAEILEVLPSKTFKEIISTSKKKTIKKKSKVVDKRTKTLTTVTTLVTTTRKQTFAQAFRKAMPKLKHVKISKTNLNKF